MPVDAKKGFRPSTTPETQVHPTLPGRDYWSPEIFELERERIFHAKWLCVGREEQLSKAGDYLVREIIDESILVVRSKTGGLGAFYNVCRHRGSQLCDDPQGNVGAAIKCPYHAWAYSHDGQLIGTPNVGTGDGFDPADYPLYSIAVDTWDGFIFVNLAPKPLPLSKQVSNYAKGFSRYRIGNLRVGKRIEYEVAANWKIVVENYNECLHCPTVHPELTRIVPSYHRGGNYDDPDAGADRMMEGATTFSMTGRSKLPGLPGLSDEDRRTYYGFTVFPNLVINLHSDHVMTYILEDLAPERTRIISEFLFEEATIRKGGFDPSEVVELWDLVGRQDWEVCERTQRGVRSRAYRTGVYPPKDRFVYEFNQRYLRERGASTRTEAKGSR